MIPIDLSGKTALVTGGGQGLGATTAAVLAHSWRFPSNDAETFDQTNPAAEPATANHTSPGIQPESGEKTDRLLQFEKVARLSLIRRSSWRRLSPVLS